MSLSSDAHTWLELLRVAANNGKIMQSFTSSSLESGGNIGSTKLINSPQEEMDEWLSYAGIRYGRIE